MIETTSDRRDMDLLLDQMLATARAMLRKQGTVAPFGAITKNDGRMRLVASAGTASTSPEEVMELVVAGIREQAEAGEIRACGVCYEVQVPTDQGELSDAIAVELEDVLGASAMVHMPFTRGRFSSLRFDEVTVSAGQPQVFVPA